MPIPFIIGAGVAAALGYSAKKGYDGYQKHSESNQIVDKAKADYAAAREIFDKRERKTLAALTELGQLELNIGKDFQEFSTLAEALLQGLNKGRKDKLKLQFPQHKLQEVERYAYSAVGVLGSIAGAGVTGAAAGFAVYGGVMTFAAASTGTAIASLSGAAATNATLAAIGGGSLATGGLGIAGGTAILGAAVAAPVLAIAGWAYDSHGEEALKNANKARQQVNSAMKKLSNASESLRATEITTHKVMHALSSIRKQFMEHFDALRGIENIISGLKQIGKDPDETLASLQDNVLLAIENGYALAAILTDIISTPLFKLKVKEGVIAINSEGVPVAAIDTDSNGAPVMETDVDGSMILNEDQIQAAITKGMESSSRFAKS